MKYYLYQLYLIRVYFHLLMCKNIYDYIFIFKWNEEIFDLMSKFKNISPKIVYDIFVSRYLYAIKRQDDLKKWYSVEKSIIDACYKCYALSPSYKDYLIRLYNINEAKIITIPHMPTRDWLERPFNLDKRQNDKLVVGYWGSVLKQHGVDKIFEAAETLLSNKNILFRIFANYRIDRKKYKHLTNIEFIDPVGDINKFINEIDNIDVAFGHLNYEQDAHLVLPSKAIEAMARGKVVIHIGSDEMIKMISSYITGEGILFFDGSIPDLVQCLEILESDRSLLREMSYNAKEMVQKYYNIAAFESSMFGEEIDN